MAKTGGAPAKRKGTRGEYLAVELLQELGFQAQRNSQRWGVTDSDVSSEDLPSYWFEVKNGYNKRAREIYDFYEQCAKESIGTGREPLVLYKADGKPFLLIADPKHILPILAKHELEEPDYLI